MIRDVYLGSGSRIRILIFYPSRIPDPGDPQHCLTDPGFQFYTVISKIVCTRLSYTLDYLLLKLVFLFRT
jgi:hypothetical protein